MIRFIDTFRDQFGVELICRLLGATARGFITSRGYRAAKTRIPAARAVRDGLLVEEIRRVHTANYGVYGVRKMWHAMRRAGWDVGRDQTARLMRLAGVTGVVRGRKPRTTVPAPLADHRPDLVMRDFKAPAPDRLWVADITYVRTSCGFVYTAFVIDAYSRRITGWATRSAMTTEALSLEALEHALNTTQGGTDNLVHHSDRGSQGGFNRSMQHLERKGDDGTTSGMVERADGQESDDLARCPVEQTKHRATFLEGDLDGCLLRRGRRAGRSVTSRRGSLVPAGWRYVNDHTCRARRPVSVVP